MKKKLIIIILCILFLTGCWDSRELNEIGIVLATCLDKEDTGKILLTAQIVRPAALSKKGGDNLSPIEIISASGDTVFKAIRNITKEFDRKSYFSHNKVLIIDEHLAEEGLIPILDVFMRAEEPRRLMWILVAKDTTAREAIGVIHGIENVQATYIDSIIKMRTATSEVNVSNLLEFIQKVSGSGINPVSGVIEIVKHPILPSESKTQKEEIIEGVKLTGTGVFKKDKLIGYLDDDETIGLNWVIGNVKGGVISIPDPTSKEDKLVAIEIKKAISKIIPAIKAGNYIFTIEVKSDGNIVEYQGDSDITKLETFEKIEEEYQKAIETYIRKTIDKVQKEYNSDIFGFGSALNKKYPKEWNKIKYDWDDIFPKVEYRVKVDAELRQNGLLGSPIESK